MSAEAAALDSVVVVADTIRGHPITVTAPTTIEHLEGHSA